MEGLNTNQTNYGDPLRTLEASLYGLSKRSKAIGANIANANTKGYIRREVNFEDHLQNELTNSSLKLDTAATNKEHFNDEITNLKDSIQLGLDYNSPSNGINNINIEKEMIDLTKVGLRFKAVSNISKKYFEGMRGIIRG
jgi:flagellar basal-body rod protein FlgB